MATRDFRINFGFDSLDPTVTDVNTLSWDDVFDWNQHINNNPNSLSGAWRAEIMNNVESVVLQLAKAVGSAGPWDLEGVQRNSITDYITGLNQYLASSSIQSMLKVFTATHGMGILKVNEAWIYGYPSNPDSDYLPNGEFNIEEINPTIAGLDPSVRRIELDDGIAVSDGSIAIIYNEYQGKYTAVPLDVYACNSADDWADATHYYVGDEVLYNGHYFKCIQEHTSAVASNEPDDSPDDNTWWEVNESCSEITFNTIEEVAYHFDTSTYNILSIVDTPTTIIDYSKCEDCEYNIVENTGTIDKVLYELDPCETVFRSSTADVSILKEAIDEWPIDAEVEEITSETEGASGTVTFTINSGEPITPNGIAIGTPEVYYDTIMMYETSGGVRSSITEDTYTFNAETSEITFDNIDTYDSGNLVAPGTQCWIYYVYPIPRYEIVQVGIKPDGITGISSKKRRYETLPPNDVTQDIEDHVNGTYDYTKISNNVRTYRNLPLWAFLVKPTHDYPDGELFDPLTETEIDLVSVFPVDMRKYFLEYYYCDEYHDMGKFWLTDDGGTTQHTIENFTITTETPGTPVGGDRGTDVIGGDRYWKNYDYVRFDLSSGHGYKSVVITMVNPSGTPDYEVPFRYKIDEGSFIYQPILFNDDASTNQMYRRILIPEMNDDEHVIELWQAHGLITIEFFKYPMHDNAGEFSSLSYEDIYRVKRNWYDWLLASEDNGYFSSTFNNFVTDTERGIFDEWNLGDAVGVIDFTPTITGHSFLMDEDEHAVVHYLTHGTDANTDDTHHKTLTEIQYNTLTSEDGTIDRGDEEHVHDLYRSRNEDIDGSDNIVTDLFANQDLLSMFLEAQTGLVLANGIGIRWNCDYLSDNGRLAIGGATSFTVLTHTRDDDGDYITFEATSNVTYIGNFSPTALNGCSIRLSNGIDEERSSIRDGSISGTGPYTWTIYLRHTFKQSLVGYSFSGMLNPRFVPSGHQSPSLEIFTLNGADFTANQLVATKKASVVSGTGDTHIQFVVPSEYTSTSSFKIPSFINGSTYFGPQLLMAVIYPDRPYGSYRNDEGNIDILRNTLHPATECYVPIDKLFFAAPGTLKMKDKYHILGEIREQRSPSDKYISSSIYISGIGVLHGLNPLSDSSVSASDNKSKEELIGWYQWAGDTLTSANQDGYGIIESEYSYSTPYRSKNDIIYVQEDEDISKVLIAIYSDGDTYPTGFSHISLFVPAGCKKVHANVFIEVIAGSMPTTMVDVHIKQTYDNEPPVSSPHHVPTLMEFRKIYQSYGSGQIYRENHHVIFYPYAYNSISWIGFNWRIDDAPYTGGSAAPFDGGIILKVFITGYEF